MKSEFTTQQELEAGLSHVLESPQDGGSLEAIFVRPAVDTRESPETATLSPAGGVHGDKWASSGADPRAQVTLMNARILNLVAGSRDRWALGGDQLIVDLDLSQENLPAGQRLAIDDAVLEVSDLPHTGCRKFSQRYGTTAARYINAPARANLNLRGVNAIVVKAGTVRRGSEVRKV